MQGSNDRFRVVSLFCGAGGLDLGFEQAGFEILWSNDIDPDACSTHRLWSKATVVCKDVKNLNPNEIPVCDVVIGGFPCQGFSHAHIRKVDDERNVLYKFFVKVISERKPKVFVAENVKGILTLDKGRVIMTILYDFTLAGYKVTANLVNAADYGVPQDRERVFLIGFRNDFPTNWRFPAPSLKKVTIREALKNVPSPLPEEICQAAYSSMFKSRNRRRGWDDQSYTIPAMAKQTPLHPSSPRMIKISENQWIFGVGKTRRLSWKEAAAIQTFPLDMEFIGNLTSIYRQIGNAVPVKLAKVIALSIKPYLRDD